MIEIGGMELLAVSLAVCAIALCYALIGHAGATGYVALLLLVGMSSSHVRVLALGLNVCVALSNWYQFHRAGLTQGVRWWPWVAGSVPAAFFGARLAQHALWLDAVLAVVLLCAAVALVWPIEAVDSKEKYAIRRSSERDAASAVWRTGIGSVIGAVSGVTGVGGGVFLSPLLVLTRWYAVRQVAVVASIFILFNSVAGLLGTVGVSVVVRDVLWAWPLPLAAILGGGLGAFVGARRAPERLIRWVMAALLCVGSVKLWVMLYAKGVL